jgi:hypothetical protein
MRYHLNKTAEIHTRRRWHATCWPGGDGESRMKNPRAESRSRTDRFRLSRRDLLRGVQALVRLAESSFRISSAQAG